MGYGSRNYQIKNKTKRAELNLKEKKARESAKRDERMKRKRDEVKNPHLREQRIATNIPVTIEQKRVWDDAFGDEGDALGWSVDVDKLNKKQKSDEEKNGNTKVNGEEEENESEDDDADSMLDDDSEADEDESSDEESSKKSKKKTAPDTAPKRAISPVGSTATNMELTPEFLQAKFPSLFLPPSEPKVLITTSLHSTLHHEGQMLTNFFPNSSYIRRTEHRFGYKYSVREISKFAANRGYTTVIVLNEDQKKPTGLDIVHLPEGPMFHFSISNWVEGRKLPGHGNPTNHFPELILNNFRTPLGLLTAHLFRTMFPPQPEFEGRQVITLHNQRDYIFVRRHRYVFRDKRASEKSIVGTDGKPVKGVEDIKAGLQELGPRFTLKLRRVDRGIQRKSGQEWQWKGKQEKARTRFQL